MLPFIFGSVKWRTRGLEQQCSSTSKVGQNGRVVSVAVIVAVGVNSDSRREVLGM
jgi:Transposase, Mutator family